MLKGHPKDISLGKCLREILRINSKEESEDFLIDLNKKSKGKVSREAPELSKGIFSLFLNT